MKRYTLALGSLARPNRRQAHSTPRRSCQLHRKPLRRLGPTGHGQHSQGGSAAGVRPERDPRRRRLPPSTPPPWALPEGRQKNPSGPMTLPLSYPRACRGLPGRECDEQPERKSCCLGAAEQHLGCIRPRSDRLSGRGGFAVETHW